MGRPCRCNRGPGLLAGRLHQVDGYATLAGPQVTGPLALTTGRADVAGPVVLVKETDQAIDIDTGGADGMQCHISKTGANLFDTLKIGTRIIAQNAHSECILQKGLETDPAAPPRANASSAT